MSFTPFSFDQRLLNNIAACGFTAPTPIQAQAMPAATQGRDVLGLAQTGTGKTAAFVLPLLQRLIQANVPRRGPARVLVLAPTRELALQIHETFIQLGKNAGYRSAAVFGGVGLAPQIKALRNATIAVACPGRLLDLLDRGEADLSAVEALVVDEADRMFDMGFLPDLRKVLSRLPSKRQNLFFSATMPKEVEKLFSEVLRDPAVVQVAHNAPAKGVSHALYPVAPHLKTAFVTTLLARDEHDSMLVFTRTKHRAKTLARKLCAQGFAAACLQGNLSQNKRQEALDGFRNGKYRVLVATDIAARGIDCERVSHVVNFDVPDTADSYTHRVGRTGRAERSGTAMTLITPEDGAVIRAIERVLGGRIERRELEGFDYRAKEQDAPAPQRRAPQGAGRDAQARTGRGRQGSGNGRGRNQDRDQDGRRSRSRDDSGDRGSVFGQKRPAKAQERSQGRNSRGRGQRQAAAAPA